MFVVFNRYGTKVYESTSPALNWDGRSSDGTELPSGLYYYQATVRFGVLDRNAPVQVFKGYVQILRDAVSWDPREADDEEDSREERARHRVQDYQQRAGHGAAE